MLCAREVRRGGASVEVRCGAFGAAIRRCFLYGEVGGREWSRGGAGGTGQYQYEYGSVQFGRSVQNPKPYYPYFFLTRIE